MLEEATSRAVSLNVLTATPIVTNPSQGRTPPDSFNESLELALPIQSTPFLTPSLTKGKKGVTALAKRAQTVQKLQSVQKEFDAERRLAESRAVPDENNPLDAIVMNCVMSLCNFGLIDTLHTGTDTPPPTEDTVLIPTVIVIASFKSNLPIDIALSVSTLLTKAVDSLCLSDDLHALFLCVPLSDGGDVTISNWRAYHTLFHSLSPLRQDIALHCGVDEQFLLRKSQEAQRDGRDTPPDQLDETTKQPIPRQNSVKKLPATGFIHSGSSELELELNELIVNPLSQFQTSSLWLSQPAISRRFYSALILSDHANEVPLTVVCAKFNVKSGTERPNARLFQFAEVQMIHQAKREEQEGANPHSAFSFIKPILCCSTCFLPHSLIFIL
ncbi:hypothetical protein BLNAU_22086 [Blattamonas nauphoetae]|uniref:POLQ-like helical domain-containing protein n=1 Tax=Blattamonas nauphoetae TaxID=2049346 RepID=A0ABQ9WU23_9EUKA|nr:hypothetical protein BLNAU_22086 [Blattamonas nauphoetae]